MMFGLRTKFEYCECGNCGCLQILAPPEDLSSYYPKNYYSFNPGNWISKFITKRLINDAYFGRDVIGKILSWRLGPHKAVWLKRIGINTTDAILDVGCGEAAFLRELHQIGFTNLTGIDPNIEQSIHVNENFRVLKQTIDEIDSKYDLVMFHHSFEHLDNPLAVLQSVYEILQPDSYALIRIPIADSYAWQHYDVNWVQLDAPRHLFLHTRESMKFLAQKAKFEVVEVVCDSTAFQFIGSELYKMDIPLRTEIGIEARKARFGRKELNQFRKHASVLNTQNEGDQACFYLYKSH